MAWPTGAAASAVFGAYIADSLNRTAALDLNSDSVYVALFSNAATPDKNAASASTGYNTGTWLLANEVTDAGGWTAGGKLLTVTTSAFSAGTFTFAGSNIASGTITVGISNAYGVLVYDNTLATPVAKQGICFLGFGGAVSAPSGTLTIQWNAAGLFTITY